MGIQTKQALSHIGSLIKNYQERRTQGEKRREETDCPKNLERFLRHEGLLLSEIISDLETISRIIE